jgi:maleate isomerase
MAGSNPIYRDAAWYRRQSKAIGVITPSANVIVERVTTAILAEFPDVSAHFSRTSVKGSRDAFPDSYDWDGMLGAARLLGDATPDVICWNGSKAGSIGLDLDRELCDRITQETGIAATTSMLAIEAVLKQRKLYRVGLVTPYTGDYQDKILKTFKTEGFACIAEAHAGIEDNLSFAYIGDQMITAMIRSVARSKPDVIVTCCTNFPAAHLVAPLESETGIPILDSVSIGVWQSLRAARIPIQGGAQWGSLFANSGTEHA